MLPYVAEDVLPVSLGPWASAFYILLSGRSGTRSDTRHPWNSLLV